jgi:hypothetical protein
MWLARKETKKGGCQKTEFLKIKFDEEKGNGVK